MAHVHFDNTEDETHAALVHDCQDLASALASAMTARQAGARCAVVAAVRPAGHSRAFRDERHQLAAMAARASRREHAGGKPEDVEIVRRGSRMIKRVRIDGCWYRTLDLDAGIRAYMGPRGAKRFWHGYYSGKAIDHFTGGVIPIVDSASRRSTNCSSDHYDLVRHLVGDAPETAIGDKGFSVERVFRSARPTARPPSSPGGPAVATSSATTRRPTTGTASPLQALRRADQLRPLLPRRPLKPDERSPRLWLQCIAGATDDARRADHRLLIRLTAPCPALAHRSALPRAQGIPRLLRGPARLVADRYKVAADDLGVRPKIRDIGWHRLRANVAALVDWLRICYREGWLGKPRRNHLGTERKFKDRGRGHQRSSCEDARSHGDHGRIRRERRTARPGQANTALTAGSRRTRR